MYGKLALAALLLSTTALSAREDKYHPKLPKAADAPVVYPNATIWVWPQGTTPPTPEPPNPNPDPASFTLDVPHENASVQGPITVSGKVGAQWKNIGCWSPTAANGRKVAPDVQPTTTTWSTTADSTLFPPGNTSIECRAFASAPGQPSSDTSTALVHVVNANSVTPPGPQAGFDHFGLPNTPTVPTLAVSNFAFLQSQGMNTWPANNGTPQQLADMMKYVGARHDRGTRGPTAEQWGDDYRRQEANIINASDPNWHFKLVYFLDGHNGFNCGDSNACYSRAGIGDGANPANGTEIKNMVDLANAGLLLYIESYNEPGNFKKNWEGQAWGGGAATAATGSWNLGAQAQAYIYDQIQKNPTLGGHYAFSSQTFIGAMWDNSGMQCGNVIPAGCGGDFITAGGIAVGTKFADAIATHPYRNPANGDAHRNGIWDNAQKSTIGNGESFYEGFVRTWNRGFPGLTGPQIDALPAMATEYGENTENQVNKAQALLLMQTEHFFSGCKPGQATCVQGIKINAPYSLVDNDGGWPNGFGLFGTSCGGNPNCGNPTFTPHAAATYLHNLTTILYDTPAPFTPGSVNWSGPTGCPTGGNQNVSICHGGLLQSSNGHYWLLVMVDGDNGGQVNPVIDLGQQFAHVNRYDPAVGTGVLGNFNNQRNITLNFPVRGVQILELY